jgi:hypothetical protein
MNKVFAAFQGRHTAAISAFFVMGNIFHYLHRLDGTYISFMTIMMGYVLGHSIKDDYFSQNQNNK